MIDISVVSGTFNRLGYLQKMVQSVRDSFSGVEGLSWDLVLVDGGSSDGTLQWLAEQPDCRVVEHGMLKGAIRAFNDGAYAATGNYVVLANDDVEFVGDSLPRAWGFMEARPDCGIGCFYQDRGGKRWHVEGMPVVVDGRQANMVYGQVCIVPKALGDRVGWWGEWHHRENPTYGGDNELSCQVYEAGYQVLPLYFGAGEVAPREVDDVTTVCAIRDDSPDDGLRKMNNIEGAKDPRAVRGHHPDSWAWGEKWRRRHGRMSRLVGPLVQAEPQFRFSRPAPRERFVYLPIYERGWEIQKAQKRGLREALGRAGVVTEVDYLAHGDTVPMFKAFKDACRRVSPTVVLTQLHNPDPIDAAGVAFMRSFAPDAWWVNWNGDFWPDNLLSEGGMSLARAFDLQLTVNRDALEEYRRLGVGAAYWQIGWEPDGVGHEPDRPEHRSDVCFLANGYSKERRALVERLRRLPWDFALWGQGWPDGWARGACLYDFVTACRIYRGARFSVGDSQWPESGFVSNRVMQALAAGGSALCHQWFRGMGDLGLEDGRTCVVWRSFEELREKLAYYDRREEHRASIARNGEALALDRHSFDARVRELLAMREDVEDWR